MFVSACPPQEALADGQEGMLALQEALERTVDAARGLLERAEVAAAEAEDGEVSAHSHEGCAFALRPPYFGRASHTSHRHN